MFCVVVVFCVAGVLPCFIVCARIRLCFMCLFLFVVVVFCLLFVFLVWSLLCNSCVYFACLYVVDVCRLFCCVVVVASGLLLFKNEVCVAVLFCYGCFVCVF